MNILFYTIGRLADINTPGIYTDLLRKFNSEGHSVYIISARERKLNLPTEYSEKSGFHFVRVRIGNITQCGKIEKGISTVMVERQYLEAIKRYLSEVRFDLLIYTTPPITFLKAVEYVKKEMGQRTIYFLRIFSCRMLWTLE